jgi:hypothetical protein
MVVALDWKQTKTLDSALPVLGAIQSSVPDIPTELLGHFKVEKRWSGKLTRLGYFIRVPSLWIQNQLVDDAGIDDGHCFSATPYPA